MDPPKNEDFMSTLAKENGWLSDDNCPLYMYQGFWYHGFFLRGAIAAQCFEACPADVIIASNPKSGTTWLKALAFAIRTRGRFSPSDPNNHPLHTKNPHGLIPWLEIGEMVARRGDLNLVCTHLPYTGLPPSIAARGCKIVYIWRDPKDAFVSRWLYSHKIRPNKEGTEPIPLQEAFELFCSGVSSFGPYWDHVLGYRNALLDRPESVLLLKYEDMMDDVEPHIRRLAEFIGCPFSATEEAGGMLARVAELCSFERLSNLEVNKGGVLRKIGEVSFPKEVFFRKAKVGDWSNYLTQEMAAKIDRITKEKLGP